MYLGKEASVVSWCMSVPFLRVWTGDEAHHICQTSHANCWQQPEIRFAVHASQLSEADAPLSAERPIPERRGEPSAKSLAVELTDKKHKKLTVPFCTCVVQARYFVLQASGLDMFSCCRSIFLRGTLLISMKASTILESFFTHTHTHLLLYYVQMQ